MSDSQAAAQPVLVLNAGSSSLKFALLDPASRERFVAGVAERLSTPEARLLFEADGSGSSAARERAIPGCGHGAAVPAVLEALDDEGLGNTDLLGVGHRVVHGGERFTSSVLIDDQVVAAVEDCERLAPLHNSPALDGIRAARAALPDVPQVAVFDTAFHQTLPPRAYRYAVPDEWYTDFGVRRYGFHGTSVRYVSRRAASILGRPLGELALVVAHLGNGCSATAVLHGESVDTTMGMTPLEGLVMGTRSGDLDPGVFGYLTHEADLSVDETSEALNARSGLLGLSGLSNDVRAIEKGVSGGDQRAALALDVFSHRLAKAIAALVVSLGRLDALVFTGGIGEHSAGVRRRTVEPLGFLGLAVDAVANAADGGETDGRISVGDRPAVLVVPTDEELQIALDTAEVVAGPARVRPGG